MCDIQKRDAERLLELFQFDLHCVSQIEIERTTGDVVFENCDAAALDIETDTGDVYVFDETDVAWTKIGG